MWNVKSIHCSGGISQKHNLAYQDKKKKFPTSMYKKPPDVTQIQLSYKDLLMNDCQQWIYHSPKSFSLYDVKTSNMWEKSRSFIIGA